MVIGNGLPRSQRKLMPSSHNGLSWVSQINMFIVQGLLLFPFQLVPVAGVSVVIALFLALVARPLSVFICLLPFNANRSKSLSIKGASPQCNEVICRFMADG